jgi:hypothetical protein
VVVVMGGKEENDLEVGSKEEDEDPPGPEVDAKRRLGSVISNGIKVDKDGVMDDSSEDRRMRLSILGKKLNCTPRSVAVAMAIVFPVRLYQP